MRMKRRRFWSLLLCAAMALTMLAGPGLQANAETADYPVGVAAAGTAVAAYVALGDSIATGYGLTGYSIGKTPANAYVSVVGNDLNLPAVNLAVDGLTSTQLLAALISTDSSAVSAQAALANAQTITLSIGSNDVLGPFLGIVAAKFGCSIDELPATLVKLQTSDPVKLAGILAAVNANDGTGLKNNPALQSAAAAFSSNVTSIITGIKKLAPDAQIYVTNAYNPYQGISLNYGLGTLDLGTIADGYIRSLNGAFKADAGNYTLIDVYSAFSASLQGGAVPVNANLAAYNFDPHPNAVGHALIAKLILTQNSAGQGGERIYGETQYDTAVAIAQANFGQGADTVVLARGDNSADALPAVPLAKYYHAPLLLTQPSSLSAGVLAEIKALGAKRIVIVGGPGAVQSTVEGTIKAAGLQVERVYGHTQYDTAYEIAKRIGSTAGQAVLVNGDKYESTYADPLSISAWAGYHGVPILYVDSTSNKLPEATARALSELKISRTLLIGGTAVVPAALEKLVPNPERYGGNTAYDTNALVLKNLQPDPGSVYLATGKGFGDALAGAAVAAQNNGWLILTGGSASGLTGEQEELLRSEKDKFNGFQVFGGSAVVPESIIERVEELLD